MAKPKPTEPQHFLGMFLPLSHWQKLRLKAAKEGKTTSAFVRLLIKQSLKG